MSSFFELNKKKYLSQFSSELMTYQLDEWQQLRSELENDSISLSECFDRCLELNQGKHSNQPWNSKQWQATRKILLGNQTVCQSCGIDTSLFREKRLRYLVLQHPPGSKHQLSIVGECESKEDFLSYIDSIISYRSLETVTFECYRCSFHADSSSPVIAMRKQERTSPAMRKAKRLKKKYREKKVKGIALTEHFLFE